MEEIAEDQDVLNMQKTEIQRIRDSINIHRKQVKDRKTEFQDKISK